MAVDFAYDFRGNASLSLAPQAGDTRWTVRSSWPQPELRRRLPARRARRSTTRASTPTYRIGNLALGRSLVSHRRRRRVATSSSACRRRAPIDGRRPAPTAARSQTAQISLIQPVDLYSQVNRATKYGFLFIGFTFLALLMFDVIGGVRVSAVEYLLMGAALVLFFVLLLAFAEVIGFTPPISSPRRRSPGSTRPIRRRCSGAGGGLRSSAGCSSASTRCSTSCSASRPSRC